MTSSVNIYCDESCHLERDAASVMVLGAIACPTVKAREIADRLRDFRDFSYIVVLAERRDYVGLSTAYVVEHASRRRKLRNECEGDKTSWGRP